MDSSAPTPPYARTGPAQLGMLGVMMFVTDAIAALLIIAIAHAFGYGAPAFLVGAATLLAGLAMGRYQASFAVTPREEWYAAGGLAVLGGLIGVLFTLALGFEILVAAASAVFWWIAASLAAAFLHRWRVTQCATSLQHVRESTLGSRWRTEQHLIRALDVVLSLVALAVLWPVMLLIALIVAVDDGLPVLFTQSRVARDDRDFTMLKFRTMKRDAGPQWASPDDDRITRSGRRLRSTSLDELPQLINVLGGSMSLVGPRPEMREYAAEFSRTYAHYSQRHIVRPGLTGWAQVRFVRNFQPEDFATVLEHDLFYVQYASVQLYMFCIVKTACEIFRHKAV